MSFPFMKPLIDVPHDMSFPFRGELSDLPDKILHEIVSHLCRILSRKWQQISKYSRNLDFDSQRELDANLDLRMSFLQFVHWVFIFNEAETIERFHLRCHEKINCGMGKVFQALCKVERLSISSITVQCLVYHSHTDIPRSFDNLLELEISFKDSHWNLLLKLLQRSPKLERLVIHKESNSSATPKLKKLPALPLVLRVFAFNNCEGSEDDLGFIECMLQNAEGLERMRIDFASSTDSHTQNQTAEKVSSFPRSSTNCQLKFNHIP